MKRVTGVTGLAVGLLVYGLPGVVRGAEQIKYYDIAGGSTTELREALNRQRPVGPDGLRHDAVTLWYTRWQYKTATSGRGCAVASFEVSLEIVTILPRWTDETAPSSLVARWRNYYAALLLHEDGHKAIAVETAAAVRKAGTNVPSTSSCAELAQAIDRVANDTLEQYREKQRQYDKTTQHGRTQGARFP